MNWTTIAAAAAALILFSALARTRALGGMLASAAGGIAGLWAVSLVPVKGAVLLAPNAFTLSVSSLLGLPGVAGLLFLRVLTAA